MTAEQLLANKTTWAKIRPNEWRLTPAAGIRLRVFRDGRFPLTAAPTFQCQVAGVNYRVNCPTPEEAQRAAEGIARKACEEALSALKQ